LCHKVNSIDCTIFSITYFLTIFIIKLKENASTLTIPDVATIFPTELGKKPNDATEWKSGIVPNESTTTPNDGTHSTGECIILPKQTVTSPNELIILPKQTVTLPNESTTPSVTTRNESTTAPNYETNQIITLPNESTPVPKNSGDLFNQPIFSSIESETIPNDKSELTIPSDESELTIILPNGSETLPKDQQQQKRLKLYQMNQLIHQMLLYQKKPKLYQTSQQIHQMLLYQKNTKL
jgi:hypothetical protein